MSDALLDWLMPKIKEWRQYRDSNFEQKWNEYYRIWRGVWDEQDKLRDSERSRLISPATQQAVEGSVAELEEATFGRDQWFDMSDDAVDQQPEDIADTRRKMKEDLERERVRSSIGECFLNGAVFGTAIGEIVVEQKKQLYPMQAPIPGTQMTQIGSGERDYVCVKLHPVSPFNFSTDPMATFVDEALGCEITEWVDEHVIQRGIEEGRYEDVELEGMGTSQDALPGETARVPTTDKIKLTRYYGLVPQGLLNGGEDDEDENLVEAVVFIANDQTILKAKKSPYVMQDRPVVAYQHDRVPGRFWGRGVVEKGYNAQKALDTELRARADNLALTTHPMMAVDASRLPRGMNPKVMPGKTILTNGNPKEILFPMNFGNLNPVSFRESAELERMVTMGTGTMDTAAPMGVNPRNNTLGGMSMMVGASIKRQKRTLFNFQESFLIPFITKAAWRFMQYAPQRYPSRDFKFTPSSTMGLMAREYEQQQLVTMLGYIDPKSPAATVLLMTLFQNSSLQDREQVVAQLKQALDPNRPNPELQIQQQQMAMQAQGQMDAKMQKDAELQLRAKELQLRQLEIMLRAQDSAAKAQTEQQRLAAENVLSMLEERRAANNDANDNMTNRLNAHANLIKARAAARPKPASA